MRTALERTPQMRDRLFTPGEQGYCDERSDPTERYAARFAAKEAVLKALGLGIGACKWREIEVARADGGAPSVRLHGAAARLGAGYGRHVIVLAGKGNNGADGRAAATRLRRRGVRVTTIDAEDAPDLLPAADLVIDAAYGTGFRGDHVAPHTTAPVLAVDIPS